MFWIGEAATPAQQWERAGIIWRYLQNTFMKCLSKNVLPWPWVLKPSWCKTHRDSPGAQGSTDSNQAGGPGVLLGETGPCCACLHHSLKEVNANSPLPHLLILRITQGHCGNPQLLHVVSDAPQSEDYHDNPCVLYLRNLGSQQRV